MSDIIEAQLVISVVVIFKNSAVLESEIPPHPPRIDCMDFLVGDNNFLGFEFVIQDFRIHEHERFFFLVWKSNKTTFIF